MTARRPDPVPASRIILSRVYSAQDVTVTDDGTVVFVNMENASEGRTRLVLMPSQADALGDFVQGAASTVRNGEPDL